MNINLVLSQIEMRIKIMASKFIENEGQISRFPSRRKIY